MENKILLGKCYIGDGENLLFLTYEDLGKRVSELLLMKDDGSIEFLLNDYKSPANEKLYFHPEHQIEAVFRIRNGCDKTVYFTDNYNDIRSFTVNSLHNYLPQYVLDQPNYRHYALASKFRLMKMYDGKKSPVIDDIEVIEGGSLDSGSCNLAIQYLDADFNPTQFIETTEPVILYVDNQDTNFQNIRGSNNNTLDYQNFGKTKKSIKLEISNLDKNYAYIRVAAIFATSGNGLVNKVLCTNEISIKDKVTCIINDSTLITELTELEVQAYNYPIYRAKTIEQIDNTLVLGNTKDKQIDWCKLQKYASKIKSSLTFEQVDLNKVINNESRDDVRNDFKSAVSNLKQTGYMPGEVYSYGIVYQFADGYESPAYHIPCTPNPDFNRTGAIIPRECENTFYEPRDCTANYWGIDGNGISLEGKKVRHHQFPFRHKVSKDLLIERNNKLTKVKKSKYYFYIQFRKKAYPRVQMESDISPFGFVGTNLKNVRFYNGQYYQDVNCTSTVDIDTNPLSSPGYKTPGDLTYGSDLSYSYYSRFKSKFNTIKLIIRLRYNDGTVEAFDYEVSANDLLKPIDKNGKYDVWGIKYDVPDNGKDLESVTIVELPQAVFEEGEEEDSDRKLKVTWLTTGDRSRARERCPEEDDSNDANAKYCIDYLKFYFINRENRDFSDGKGFLTNYENSGMEHNYIYKNGSINLSYGQQSTDFNTSSVHMYGSTPYPARSTDSKKLLSYINPCPIIYKVDYEDIIDERRFTSDIMGIQFTNIQKPVLEDYILDETGNNIDNQIVGYRIVRHKRDDFNKTILDSAILTPVIKDSVNTTDHKYSASGLLYPLFKANDVVANDTTKRVESNIFGVIHPEHKFNKLEIPNDCKVVVEGFYYPRGDTFNDINYSMVSSKNQELWITEDVQEGTTYDKSSKRGEVDYDGWQLNIYNKHIYIKYGNRYAREIAEQLSQFENAESNEVFYLDGLTYKEIDETSVFNLSADNKIGFIKFKTTNPISLLAYNKKYDNIKINNAFGLKLDYGTSGLPIYPYVKFQKHVSDPYGNFENLEYYPDTPIQRFPLSGSLASCTVFNGDTYISPLKYRNTVFYDNRTRKREKKDGIWQIVLGGIGIVGGAVITIFAGPVGIAAIAANVALVNSGIKLNIAKNVYTSLYNQGLGKTLDDVWTTEMIKNKNPKDDEIQWLSESFDSFWFESSINMNWRNGFTFNLSDFEDPLNGYGLTDTKKYLLDKLTAADTQRNNNRVYLGFAQSELYELNKDYQRRNQQKKYFILSRYYDCCATCKEVHPLRMYYSQQSYQEERVDNYAIFLPNNYVDIPGEQGEITKVITFNKNLAVLCTEGVFVMPKKYQERVVDQIVSYIGTGEMFSIPAMALSEDNSGRNGGCTSQWAVIRTPAGIIFPSVNEESIFLLTIAGEYRQSPQLFPISDNGMNTWFNEKLKLDTNYDNPSNPSKTGYIAVYDETKDRVIITKKDPYIEYDEEGNKIVTERGFTISYSLKDKSWISFHSYIPNMYISSYNGMYSWLYNDKSVDIWQHGVEGSYQTFYDKYYPFIVEYVSKSKSLETTVWDNVQFNTIANKHTEEGFVDDRDTTFNMVIYYNSRQCTNLKRLIPKNNLDQERNFFTDYIDTFNGADIVIERKEKDWYLNYIRDAVIEHNSPIWINNIPSNNEWMSSNNLNGWIDKSLNQNVFGFKEWYDDEPFRDKFIIQRYIFNDANKSNIQLVVSYNIDNKTVSLE